MDKEDSGDIADDQSRPAAAKMQAARALPLHSARPKAPPKH